MFRVACAAFHISETFYLAHLSFRWHFTYIAGRGTSHKFSPNAFLRNILDSFHLVHLGFIWHFMCRGAPSSHEFSPNEHQLSTAHNFHMVPNGKNACSSAGTQRCTHACQMVSTRANGKHARSSAHAQHCTHACQTVSGPAEACLLCTAQMPAKW